MRITVEGPQNSKYFTSAHSSCASLSLISIMLLFLETTPDLEAWGLYLVHVELAHIKIWITSKICAWDLYHSTALVEAAKTLVLSNVIGHGKVPYQKPGLKSMANGVYAHIAHCISAMVPTQCERGIVYIYVDTFTYMYSIYYIHVGVCLSPIQCAIWAMCILVSVILIIITIWCYHWCAVCIP